MEPENRDSVSNRGATVGVARPSTSLCGRWLLLLFVALLVAGGALLQSFAQEADGQESASAKAPAATESPQDIEVPAPPFSDGIFPCTQCHDGQTVPLNRTRRKLVDMHDDIVLNHGPNRWCLDCHSAENRDKLHLVDGTLIDFSKSYLLCGQCHGDKLRDWKAGVHGKRTGHWNGRKEYLLCVHCHNPHSPHFAPLKPMPPPVPPAQILPVDGGQP